MLRPKDITDQLGISAPTLRVWSNTFAPVLSPGAQSSKTESGGNSQRRYTEQDLAYFRQAKALLDGGSTFEQALATLQSEPLPETAESLPTSDKPPADVAVIEQPHPVLQAFEEALKAKDQVIKAKDETISLLNARINDLTHSLTLAQAQPSERIVEKPVFRWSWLNRLLTEDAEHVG